MIPPKPTNGIVTALDTCHTMRTATGLMAGPDSPPILFANTGRRRWMSIFIPTKVLINESASAPPASQARAISAILVTLGLSFTIKGWRAFCLTNAVTRSASVGHVPMAMPPCLTLGHEILSSNISTGSFFKRSATSAYSSGVLPTTLTMTLAENCRRNGKSSRRNASTPGFCNPTALSIPP
jgi:hypothetical protein